MITKTLSYAASDGTIYPTLEAAQIYELATLLDEIPAPSIPAQIVEQKARVIDILSTNSRSRPKARKINKAKLTPKEQVLAQPSKP